MSFDVIWALILSSLVISISPGSGAVLTISSSLNYGFKKSYASILGLQVGYLAQAFIVIIGLGAIIISSHVVFNAIKYIGALYLAYLGLQKIFCKVNMLNIQNVQNSFNFKKLFTHAILVNLTNVKATVLLIAFIPQFINPSKNIALQFCIISTCLVLVDIFVMSCYSTLASKLRKFLKTQKAVKIQNIIIGSLLIFAGIFLVLK